MRFLQNPALLGLPLLLTLAAGNAAASNLEQFQRPVAGADGTDAAQVEESAADDLLATDNDPLGFVPSVGLGISGMLYSGMDRTGETSNSVLGPAAFATLAYNTGFFLRPFIDISYMTLYSSRFDTPYGAASASTTAISSVLGASYRRFGFRLRGGLGGTLLKVHSEFPGAAVSAYEWDLTEYLALSRKVFEFGKFWVWAEARAHFVLSAGTSAFSLSLTMDYGGWLKPRQNH